MPRIRSITPEFWSRESLCKADTFSRILYIGMHNFADDDGRGRCYAKELNGFVFPNDLDVDAQKVQSAIDVLNTHGLITVYSVSGTKYFQIMDWDQKPNRKTDSRIPSLSSCEASVSNHGVISDDSPLGIGNQDVGIGSEVLGIGQEELGIKNSFALTSAKTPRPSAKPKADPAQTSTPVWEAYSESYEKQYGVAPIRNMQANTFCKRLIERIGMDNAVKVAAWFPSHRASWYVTKGHSLQCLLGDCEKLLTECVAGFRVHTQDAREMDHKSAEDEKWVRAERMYEERKAERMLNA
jgi:hypothetical protein